MLMSTVEVRSRVPSKFAYGTVSVRYSNTGTMRYVNVLLLSTVECLGSQAYTFEHKHRNKPHISLLGNMFQWGKQVRTEGKNHP